MALYLTWPVQGEFQESPGWSQLSSEALLTPPPVMVWHLRHCPQPSKLVIALPILSSLSPSYFPMWVLIGSPRIRAIQNSPLRLEQPSWWVVYSSQRTLSMLLGLF